MLERHRDLLVDAFLAGVDAASARRRLPSALPTTAAKGRTIVLGAGKAAGEMAAVADSNLAGEVSGIVLTRYQHSPPVPPTRIRVVECGHPVPDDASFAATLDVMRMAESAGPDDRVVFLISGGGSALLSCPGEGVTRREKQAINAALIRSGASISEINLVRSHLSKVKGGRLAEAAHPASLLTYIISDVVGDDPALVGSGPSIAGRHDPDGVRARIQALDIELSPEMDAALGRVQPVPAFPHPVEVIATSTDALEAVDAFLRQRGWPTERIGDDLAGDATEVGARHALTAARYLKESRRVALISGGELTVRVHNPDGQGGPSLEYLASLMINLGETAGIEAIACDSDGIDGSQDNAGGYLGPGVLTECKAHNLDVAQSLRDNQTYLLFKSLDGLVVTGPTRTNVNDIRIILVEGPE